LLGAADYNKSHGFTQELRAVSAPGDSPWKWLAGAYYYDMKLYDCADTGAGSGFPGLPSVPVLEALGLLTTYCPQNTGKMDGAIGLGQLIGDIELKESALFGEVTRELGRYWEATVGLRGYRIETDGTVTTNGLVYASQSRGPRDAEVSEDGLSPKASLTFKPTRDMRIYFTASRGFRFGGPQLSASSFTAQVPAFYKSDSLWNYELGLRSDWLDHSLQFDVSAYRIDWKDPQVQLLTPDGLQTYVDNVGGARGYGSEASLRYNPTFLRNLVFGVTASWNRTVTTKPFDATDGIVASGSPWPLAPRWQTSTTLAYLQPVESWVLGASLRHTYAGQACNDIECEAQVFGYRTLDLNVFAHPPEASYWPQVSVSLNNLSDERGYSSIVVNPLNSDVTYIAPRSLVLRLSGNF
ncbi:MAG: TonB-dependent receptor, partial [Myxococcota bacterium]